MTGQATVWRDWRTRASSGCSQPAEHSQCASRNVSVAPPACWAPSSRAATRPRRSGSRRTRVRMGRVRQYSSSGAPRKVRVLASSTSRISCSRAAGERLMTDQTVRSNTDQASLWNTTMTVVLGSVPVS